MIKTNFIKLKTLIALLLILNIQDSQASLQEKRIKKSEIKLLVLIIASDTFDGLPVPIYPELEKAWRSYMHLDPDHVEAYFIKADPDLSTPFQIKEDVIWSKTVENRSPGILNKTILSLECLSGRLEEFNYVLRTNLSSFFIFPRLLKALETIPRTGCYFGENTGGDSPYGSGCGFVMSSDLAKLLIRNKDKLYNVEGHDDIMIGNFFINRGIKLLRVRNVEIANAKEWDEYKTHIDPNVFHFRIKNPQDSLRFSEQVYKEDLYIHHEIIQLFYNGT